MDTSNTFIKVLKDITGIAISIFVIIFYFSPSLAKVPIFEPIINSIFSAIGNNDAVFKLLIIPVIVLMSAGIIFQGFKGLQTHYFMGLSGKRAELWSVVWILLGVFLVIYTLLYFLT